MKNFKKVFIIDKYKPYTKENIKVKIISSRLIFSNAINLNNTSKYIIIK